MVGVGTHFISRLQRRLCVCDCGWDLISQEGWGLNQFLLDLVESGQGKGEEVRVRTKIDNSSLWFWMFRHFKTKQNKKVLFSILSWKWSESKLKVVASRSEVDLSVGKAPISDWPRWDLGAGSTGWGLHKTVWYSVVYSSRIDDPFLNARTSSGSWRFREEGGDTANPDLSGPGGVMPERNI